MITMTCYEAAISAHSSKRNAKRVYLLCYAYIALFRFLECRVFGVSTLCFNSALKM